MKKFFIITLLFLLVCFKAYSGWERQNPIPGSCHINKIFFINSKIGWAVGEEGAIIKTIDSGNTWNSQKSSITDKLTSVYFSDSLYGWVCGASGKILNTSDGGNNWNLQNSNTSNQLNCIFFTDRLTGWAVGDTGVIKNTTDGGKSWLSQSSDTTSKLYSISFTSKNVGYVLSDRGLILKTTDKGLNWKNFSHSEKDIASICFINDMVGWALGRNDTITKTIDGGKSWKKQYVPSNSYPEQPLYNIFFIDSMNGWAVGDYGFILRTTDGGSKWTYNFFTYFITAIFFTDSKNGYITSNFGVIYKTTDSGISWATQTESLTGINFNNVFFVDSLTGWAVSSNRGFIFKTTDAGLNWNNKTPTGSGLNKIFFIDYNRGWAVGGSHILKTTNGGISWTDKPFDNYFQWSSIFFVDSLIGWAAGYYLINGPNPHKGAIIKTTDGGYNWSAPEYFSPSSRPFFFYDIAFINSNVGTAVGTENIFNTSDGGNSWNLQRFDFNNIHCLHFIDSNNGWAVSDYFIKTLIKTTNGGSEWFRFTSDKNVGGSGIFFPDTLNGWIINNYYIYRTTNGGSNWINENSGTMQGLNSVYFPNTKTGWAVGYNGTILKYTFTIAAPVLVSPKNKSSSISYDTVLYWNKVSNATSYHIQIDTTSDFMNPIVNEITTDTFKILTGLPENTTYYWHVMSKSPNDSSDWSETWSFKSFYQHFVFNPVLISPVNGSSNVPTDTLLNWSKIEDASSYYIQISSSGDFTNSIINEALTDTFKTIKGLTENTQYYWHVRAKRATDSSDWSETWSFKTINPHFVAVPSLLSPAYNSTNISPDTILKWYKVNDATSYNITLSTDRYFQNRILNEKITDTFKVIKDLAVNTQFFWAVRANRLMDSSDWCPVWNFTTGNPHFVAIPTPVSPANNSSSILTDTLLKWNSVPYATSYNIQFGISNDFTNPIINEKITDTFKILAGLAENTIYYWHVRANKTSDSSDWSGTWSFSTLDPSIVYEPKKEEEILIVPNPITNSATICFDNIQSSSAKIRIYDIGGSLVMTKDFNDISVGINKIEIDFTGFSPGIYFIKIINEKNTNTYKVIKE
jgi:photosystem II stability/assembly factor-like uncharacterized protein